MGRDLYYTINRYLEQALSRHSKVSSWQRVDHPTNDDDFLYLIHRKEGMSDLLVHASDEYEYTLTDYYQRPQQITARSFILIARPEARYDHEIAEVAKADRISIGNLAGLLGALNFEPHWEYLPKERRD